MIRTERLFFIPHSSLMGAGYGQLKSKLVLIPIILLSMILIL